MVATRLPLTGFDLSPALLALARERSAAATPAIPYVQGTVRRLPDLGPFDAVAAFYDDSPLSFEDEADNLRALRGIAHSLRPGGRLLFGTTDCPLVLPPRTITARWDGAERVEEEISFDVAAMTGTSVRRHLHPDGSVTTYRRRRRHCALAEARSLLREAGLRCDRAWCAYDPDLPYGARPEGMVIAATRTS